MAGRLGGRAHLGGAQPRRPRFRRLQAQELRARDAPLPVGRAPRRASQVLRGRRRDRPLSPPQRLPGDPPDGLRRLRPPGREPRDPHRRASARLDREVDRRPSASSSARWGVSIDWSREVATHEPDYYRWTQWIFLQLLERDLAYRAEAPVQWCPKDADRARQRAGDRRALRALRHARSSRSASSSGSFASPSTPTGCSSDFDAARVVARARRHDAAQLDRPLRGRRGDLPLRRRSISTSPSSRRAPTRSSARPSSSLAPEHPAIEALIDGSDAAPAVRAYVDDAARRSTEERSAEDREKTGVALDRTVTNPVNGEQIPMFVADYVLMEYGTGALMAVPAHDERDFDFAQKFGLEIRRVVEPGDGEEPVPRTSPSSRTPENERLVNSGDFTGLSAPEGDGEDHRLARGAGPRRARDLLPPARLAALAPALLGLPDPGRLLRDRRDRPRARGPAPGPAARRRRLPPEGQEPARDGRGLGAHRVPALRRAGAPRDRHDGHLRRLVLVLPALPRSPQRRARMAAATSPTTGCPSTSTSAGSSTRSST